MVDVSRLSQEPGTSSRVPPDEQKRKKEDGRSAAATFILRVNRAIAGADGMTIMAAGITLRLALLLWGEIQDAYSEVKYTDIDYRVYTDAARHLAEGGSPYDRATYRYTPLLAALLLPTVWWHMAGKVLFSAMDIVVAYLLDRLLLNRGVEKQLRSWAGVLWLFNPYTATISTRGNGESVVLAMVYSALLLLQSDWNVLGAALIGLAAHWRIYPAVFVLPALLWAGRGEKGVRRALNIKSAAVVATAGGTFLATGAACFAWQGWPFIREAFLYHVGRVDHRHNFSPFFLPAYHQLSSPGTFDLHLDIADPFGSALAVLTSPKVTFSAAQLVACAVLGAAYSSDPPYAFALQSVAFVAFNRVCTAQYFVWFLGLLPAVLPSMRPHRPLGLFAPVAWVSSQLAWLAVAFLVEFRGLPLFGVLWGASLAFQGATVWGIVELCLAHESRGPTEGAKRPAVPAHLKRQAWRTETPSERKRLLREARKEAKAIARKGRSRGQEEEGEGSETDD